MAFTLTTNINHYDCLSTDTKPTSNLSFASTCTELDTGKTFTFSGTTWIQTSSPNTNIKEVPLGGITVTAGSTLTMPSVDISDADTFTLAVIFAGNHVWSSAARFLSVGDVYSYINSEIALTSSVNQGTKICTRQIVLAPRVLPRITNGDVADHTYTVVLNKIGLKLS